MSNEVKCPCGTEDCPKYGLCHQDGCDEPTPAHRYSVAKRGWVKGEHKLCCRRGHTVTDRKKPVDLTPCECGCGEMVVQRFAQGHNLKVIDHSGPNAWNWIAERWVEEDRGYDTPCWVWQLAVQSMGYAQTDRHLGGKLVHRVMYEEHVGPIPAGWVVHHKCEQARCVNPRHLEAKPPAAHTRGHMSKLTEEDVRAIVRSPKSHRELAEHFGMNVSSISNIRIGDRWGDVVRDEWEKLGGRPTYPRSRPAKAA